MELPIIDDKKCPYKVSYPEFFTESLMCAGYLEGGKSPCDGDAGGPLVCNGELQGIVNWGHGCGKPTFPHMYTRVCDYVDWIENTIRMN